MPDGTEIDLNCDMAESFGRWSLGADEELMPLITSANIACGYHAGDPPVMERAVRLALSHDVAIGAHPSYPDLQGFGRRSLSIGPDELGAMLLYQVGALDGVARANGGVLRHVKLHGALYNDAAHDPALAAAVVKAVQRLNTGLLLYVLSGSRMAAVAREIGAPVVEEAFADRRYNPDGSLQSRAFSGSLIADPDEAAAQALDIALHGVVRAHDGSEVRVPARTICIHGDNPAAGSIARAVRARLEERGISLAAPR